MFIVILGRFDHRLRRSEITAMVQGTFRSYGAKKLNSNERSINISSLRDLITFTHALAYAASPKSPW
jgi:hypothetical protein